MATKSEVMGIKDMRIFLRTSPERVKQLLETGVIPGAKINERGDWRALREDVEAYLRGKR